MKPDKDFEKLFTAFAAISPLPQIIQKIRLPRFQLSISGLDTNSLLSLFCITLIHQSRFCPLAVFSDPSKSEAFLFDIESFLPPKSIAFFPDSLTSDDDYRRFLVNGAAHKILTHEAKIIIASIGSFALQLPGSDSILQASLTLKTGLHFSKQMLIEKLSSFHYQRQFSVGYPGEFAARGEIVDIYPYGSDHPCRIEYFSDTIESIRTFDKESLQTLKSINTITLFPIIAEINENPASLSDYLSDNALPLLSDYDINPESYENLLESDGSLSALSAICLNKLRNADFQVVFKPIAKNIRGLGAFKKHINHLFNNHLCENFFFFCSDSGQKQRIDALFHDQPITIFDRPLSSGFESPADGFFLYTDTEIFSRRQKTRSFSFLPQDVVHTKFDSAEISYNDFIVHHDYGIGRYLGLTKVNAFGAERECLVLAYAGNDKVYVPLEKMALVHKYRTSGDIPPKISRLGSPEWDRIKLTTRRSIESLSKEIIELYSKRLHSDGFQYSPDNELQLSMETEFPYEETPDQITAINDIKKDMETTVPMDRLLCGDVGFGKTEVAIRAAFKAVNDSKQVAILTPTTILADQHYFTFKKRLDMYPVTVERLSRFVKASDQRNILKNLSSGNIDILIGTHRILSKDVRFADLGLLIIDEEHRFGVKDKDKIKRYRTSIDVLSLSATPIPRSLHFSLIGARDFSLITTPPKERLPIFTEIISFDKNIIKNAVNREISRNGQIFFVHNEIKTIAAMADTLRQIFPGLNIQYIHGQMSEETIEPVMADFINNKVHILLTTAIIESGIDIPNANTIFINKAENLGLSQLYQLRGRVGRLDRQAYAYLITSHPSRLNPNAIKRLQSIKRHTALGSGYMISLEDLEIRGSGNIFGVEQSGNIHAIGYDLYLKILQDSLADVKTEMPGTDSQEVTAPEMDINIVFPFPAYIPEEYIASESLRLSYYKQLTSFIAPEEIDNLRNVISDIFGRPPLEMENLYSLITIKLDCRRVGIFKLKYDNNFCRIYFDADNSFGSPADLIQSLKSTASELKLSYKFIPSKQLLFAIYLNKQDRITPVKQFLYHLRGSLNLRE